MNYRLYNINYKTWDKKKITLKCTDGKKKRFISTFLQPMTILTQARSQVDILKEHAGTESYETLVASHDFVSRLKN